MISFPSPILGLIASLRGIGLVTPMRNLPFPKKMETVAAASLKPYWPTDAQRTSLEKIQSVWGNWIAPVSPEDCFPHKLDSSGCLRIWVKNSVLRQHLQFQGDAWRQRLETLSLAKKVTSLRWIVGKPM